MNCHFELQSPAPFRLDLTVWALRRTVGNRIDLWDGRHWTRSWIADGAPVQVTVGQCGPAEASVLSVNCDAAGPITPVQRQTLSEGLRSTLGLDTSLDGFAALAAQDAFLGPLAQRYRGVRPPRLPSLFEALANAVACQQVSLDSGIALLGKTADRLAPRHQLPGAPPPFPTPAAVLGAGADALRELGWSARKADYLLGCAEAIACGSLNVTALDAEDDARLIQTLSQLRGIKRWSAQYVALRGMGRLAVFPVDDVGAHKHLTQWLGLPQRLDATGMQQLAQRWQPYAGMAYFLLLLRRLDAHGLLVSGAVAR